MWFVYADGMLPQSASTAVVPSTVVRSHGHTQTDFKLQSKTKTKLILSLAVRRFMPYFSYTTVYVLASRVKMGMQIRIIGLDPGQESIEHLTELQHPNELVIFESGYDKHGNWSEAKRDSAIKAAIGGERPVDSDADDADDPDDPDDADDADDA